MAGVNLKGNCYLCGKEFAKTSFKKHVLTAHMPADGEMQECALIRVDSCDPKGYWLYLDISLTSTLKTLDTFLRDIWLECCGHMSLFLQDGWEEGKNRKIGNYPSGTVLYYEYDMGDTTTLKITLCGISKRPKQRKAVRLLARNTAPKLTCRECGKEADWVCIECMWEDYESNPFYCEACGEEHAEEHDVRLPVVNSPRMGICGYAGEFDIYEFVPEEFEM